MKMGNKSRGADDGGVGGGCQGRLGGGGQTGTSRGEGVRNAKGGGGWYNELDRCNGCFLCQI